MKAKPDEIIVKTGRNGYSLYKKQRPSVGDLPSSKPKTLFYKPEYSSGNGTNELKNYFGEERLFSNPKPISLIRDMIQIGTSTNTNAVVLDFFAGEDVIIVTRGKNAGFNRVLKLPQSHKTTNWCVA